MQYSRNGYGNGMVAARRGMTPTSFREPERINLFDKLIDYWPLVEPGGARIGAILGKKLSPTGSNACQAALSSLAAVFAGSGSSYLSIASDSDVQLGNIDCSVSLWMNPTNASTAGILFSKDDNSAARENEMLLVNASNNAVSAMFNGVSTQAALVTSSNTYTNANWHHATAVFDSGSGNLSITLDGTKTTAAKTTNPGVSATALGIGGDARAGNVAGLTGAIMRVGIWKRILTDGEISYLYNGGRGRDFPWL